MDRVNLTFKKHLSILVIITILVLIIAFKFKSSFDTFTKNNMTMYNTIKILEENENELHNSLYQSIVSHYYNNDVIVRKLKENKQRINSFLIEQSSLSEEYPTSFNHLKNYKKVLPEYIESKLKLIRHISTIKNSISFLQLKLSSLVAYNKEYQKVAINMIVNIINTKNNLDFTTPLDHKSFQILKQYSFNDPKKREEHKIFLLHLEVIFKTIPDFIKGVEHIDKCEILGIINELKKSLSLEEKALRDNIDLVFIELSLLVLFFIISVYYFLLVNENKNRELFSLQKEKEQDLITDSLTGLYNRNSLLNYIENLTVPTVVVINIFEFKNVNNVLGIKGGDAILKKVSQLLLNSTEKLGVENRIFRVGADEFAVVFDDSTKEFVQGFAHSIIQTIEEYNYNFNGVAIPIDVVLGISTTPPYVKNAQTAIDSSKKGSFQKITIYTNELNRESEINNNIEMLIKIKSALSEDRVTSFFQPIVSLETKEVVKYESLVRIIEDDTIISPYEFLDIAKKSKLYDEISKKVLINSFKFAAKTKLPISINLSYRDIHEEEIRYFIFKLLREKDEDCDITFEILEDETINDYELVFNFIYTVKSHNCKISIDDFGSGYSNYEYLLKFRPDYLKIDGGLIKNIDTDYNSKMVVKSLIAFAKNTGIKTVAEFVHSEEIDKIITDLGIDYGQGYFYSPPQDLLKEKV